MPPQPAVLQTSWLRVEGPADAQACAWCRRWVGRLLPVEMQGEYGAHHTGSKACRCTFAPEALRAEAEDPGCAWG
jgi:hypothetical protein